MRLKSQAGTVVDLREGGMPYMGCIGMCRSEGYGFQVVYSGIGYIYIREFGSRIAKGIIFQKTLPIC